MYHPPPPQAHHVCIERRRELTWWEVRLMICSHLGSENRALGDEGLKCFLEVLSISMQRQKHQGSEIVKPLSIDHSRVLVARL